jgi:hypothetical protein
MTDLAATLAPGRRPQPVLAFSATVLVIASWVSGAIFGAYILSFFGGVALNGSVERWNESLPALHDARTPLATLAIGAHFMTGGVLLLLGPIQLIGPLRRTFPAVHRWLGRLYVTCAALAGAGGLIFIVTKGTIGGATMNAGFGLYGALMMVFALLAYVHARAGRYEIHRAWAIRLFALAVGSWLYRMEYGFWFLVADGAGHTSSFDGWFDAVMAFFFYLPNLVVAEVFIRARQRSENVARSCSAPPPSSFSPPGPSPRTTGGRAWSAA